MTEEYERHREMVEAVQEVVAELEIARHPNYRVRLRDQFAIATLQGLLADRRGPIIPDFDHQTEDQTKRHQREVDDYARTAFMFADAMLAARDGKAGVATGEVDPAVPPY